MGRAIVRHPQVFLMDEPLSNLDAKLRVQMRADIAKLQREIGTTTIYVTHDQVEAMTMGDRVAVMNFGVLQQVDAPQRLYDMPANLFVAGFIGTPPMNLLDSTVQAWNGDLVLQLGDQECRLPRARSATTRGHEANGQHVVVGIAPATSTREQPARPADRRGAARPRGVARLRVDGLPIDAEVCARPAPTRPRRKSRRAARGHRDEAEPGGGVPAGHQLTLGDRIPVAVEVDKLHFFERETGRLFASALLAAVLVAAPTASSAEHAPPAGAVLAALSQPRLLGRRSPPSGSTS